MSAEPGEADKDPVQAFIDDVFEEMMRETGLPHKTAVKYAKDPLAAALVEAAVASLSRPSEVSGLERVLFTQALATALANALAPTLAEALAAEILKVMGGYGPGDKEPTAGRSHVRQSAGEGEHASEG